MICSSLRMTTSAGGLGVEHVPLTGSPSSSLVLFATTASPEAPLTLTGSMPQVFLPSPESLPSWLKSRSHRKLTWVSRTLKTCRLLTKCFVRTHAEENPRSCLWGGKSLPPKGGGGIWGRSGGERVRVYVWRTVAALWCRRCCLLFLVPTFLFVGSRSYCPGGLCLLLLCIPERFLFTYLKLHNYILWHTAMSLEN